MAVPQRILDRAMKTERDLRCVRTISNPLIQPTRPAGGGGIQPPSFVVARPALAGWSSWGGGRATLSSPITTFTTTLIMVSAERDVGAYDHSPAFELRRRSTHSRPRFTDIGACAGRGVIFAGSRRPSGTMSARCRPIGVDNTSWVPPPPTHTLAGLATPSSPR